MALLFSVLFLPGMLSQSAGVDPSVFTQIAYHVQLLAISLPQIVLVAWLPNLVTPGFSVKMGWVRPTKTDVTPAVIGLLAAWAASFALAVIATAIAGPEIAEGSVDWIFDRYELVPLVLVSTLAIGYREEIFYRAYLAHRAEDLGMEPRTLLYAGVVVFGLGHLYQGVGGLVVSMVIGAVFVEVYLRFKSLHGIAIAHALFNFITLMQAGSS